MPQFVVFFTGGNMWRDFFSRQSYLPPPPCKKMQVSTRIVMNFWSKTHKCPPPKSTSTPCLSNLLLPAQYSPNALQLGRYAAAEGFRQATYFGNFWKTACVSQRLGANHRSKESKFSFSPLSQIWHVSLSVWQASSHHVSPSLSLPLCRHDCVPGLSLN